MANILTNVIPQLLAQGLLKLRATAVMPQLVNRAYDQQPGTKGSTVDVPLPPTIAASDVTPGATPPSTSDIEPGVVTIALDKWKEAAFYMTDKDMLDAMNGVMPLSASSAIESLVTAVEGDIFSAIHTGGVYNYVGTAGTTPFASDTSAFRSARALLNAAKAPMGDRRVVLDVDADANLLGLAQFTDADKRGDTAGIIEGTIGRKFGSDWYMDQNVPLSTKTSAGTILIDQGDVAIGDTEVHLDGVTTVPTVGEIFTVAGDTQTYTVLTVGTLATADLDITFSPAAEVAWANDAAVTFKAQHRRNLHFHATGIAFASRPFADADPFALAKYEYLTDPISGLTLRLEVTREHKRTRFSYDIMYGVKVVRPELVCILAG